jgi:hypothetical protein
MLQWDMLCALGGQRETRRTNLEGRKFKSRLLNNRKQLTSLVHCREPQRVRNRLKGQPDFDTIWTPQHVYSQAMPISIKDLVWIQ